MSPVIAKETASDDDLDALGLLCLWNGEPRMAELLHLNAIMVNTAGRGTESAMTPIANLKLVDRDSENLHDVKNY